MDELARLMERIVGMSQQHERDMNTIAILSQDYETQGEQLAMAESSIRQLLATRDELQAAIKAMGKA